MGILPLTGGYAAAEAMRQINPDVVAAYPITPQTPIIEKFAEFVSDGLVDTEMICVESEHSAMSACVGSSAAGARTITASSSQGIALMFEILPIVSSLRLPILMEVAARALSGPINIHCDHSDVMAVRDQGWIQIFCENAQEVYDNTLLGLKLGERVKLPVMVIQDGFITSHSVERVETLEDDVVRKFIGDYKPSYSLLDTKKPITVGPFALPDYYFEIKRQQDEAIRKSKKDYLSVGKMLSKITKRKYNLFETYKIEDADYVIIVSGSTAGTVKEVVDIKRNRGEKVGLMKIKLFRPFPGDELKDILEDKKTGVLDRSINFGSYPSLYSEIRMITQDVNSYIYGLGGRDIYVNDVNKIFSDLKREKQKLKYVGLRE
ncbi:MAG: pyruvate ferredoxin oxidoreductase [Candidatus Aenigmarchaeota archaeon ex4484_56]|nr:MAG: pyruvate ferredoxin oxidoreductase [Candidatus Aenigmarchaeota archaeon ex4484_56]